MTPATRALPHDSSGPGQITIRDSGVGFAPDTLVRPKIEEKLIASRKRGWGLTIIKGLMDEVDIHSGPDGTTVVMTKLR